MNDYVNEISDPGNKQEQEDYMKQLEREGELPKNTILIKPLAGFCLKTTSTKLISETQKKFFDQKTFINICFHEIVEEP